MGRRQAFRHSGSVVSCCAPSVPLPSARPEIPYKSDHLLDSQSLRTEGPPIWCSGRRNRKVRPAGVQRPFLPSLCQPTEVEGVEGGGVQKFWASLPFCLNGCFEKGVETPLPLVQHIMGAGGVLGECISGLAQQLPCSFGSTGRSDQCARTRKGRGIAACAGDNHPHQQQRENMPPKARSKIWAGGKSRCVCVCVCVCVCGSGTLPIPNPPPLVLWTALKQKNSDVDCPGMGKWREANNPRQLKTARYPGVIPNPLDSPPSLLSGTLGLSLKGGFV